MIVHVYVGPTLSRAEVMEELPEAVVCGPVSFGDVYRSVMARAGCVAIVDGYFERVPPVWHKEILHALSAGVRVFGASSMGALRAAELDAFGMQGIGVIYEAFRTGALEDDDEVTVVHGSEEAGFVPISEAMVNLRATMLAAARAGVIQGATAEILINAAKRRFYAERCYAAAISDAKLQGAPAHELAAFRDWLPAGRINQKAEDARSLLRHLRECLTRAPKPMRATFRLERSDAWLEACRAIEAEGGAVSNAVGSSERCLEEELKLTGVYHAALDRGVARASAIADAQSAGFRPDAHAIGHAAELIRRDLGLVQKSEFEAWCRAEGLEREELVHLFEDEARVVWARPKLESLAREQLAAGLRVTGQYRALAERAEAKARTLADLGPRGPSLSDLRMTEPELWQWFFETILGHAVPADLQRFARQSGFEDVDDMRTAVIRELYFHRRSELEESRVELSANATRVLSTSHENMEPNSIPT